MNREASKFLCGLFAGLAWTHAAYAVATSTDIVEEPVFMGRTWGVGFMWAEAVLYSAISSALGYAGWIAGPRPQTAKTSTDSHEPQNATRTAQPISG